MLVPDCLSRTASNHTGQEVRSQLGRVLRTERWGAPTPLTAMNRGKLRAAAPPRFQSTIMGRAGPPLIASAVNGRKT